MTEEARDTAGVIALPPVIDAGPLLFGLLLQRLRPVAIVLRALARVLGPALIMAGVAVGGAAVIVLRRAGRRRWSGLYLHDLRRATAHVDRRAPHAVCP